MSGEQLKKTMIAKHGSEEAWRSYMREIASRGGKKTTGATGFALMSEDKHKAISAKGGKRGKRKK